MRMLFLLLSCAVACAFPELPEGPLTFHAVDDERAERDWHPAYLERATGVASRRSTKSVAKAWPVKVLSIGHSIASYQNYGDGRPYFHHGLDIRADTGSDVIAAVGGRVLGVNHYRPGSAYWEVAIQDADGFIWQYHHVDHDSIPQEIHDAVKTGNPIAAGTKIGEVYYWSISSFGERYHHIHLNVIGKDQAYLNGFAFLPSLADDSAPRIAEIGLLKNGRKVSGDHVTGKYSVYARVEDLILSRVFTLPPHHLHVSVDDRDPVVVWQFDNLPGGSDESKFVHDYYVPSMACGDYDCRRPVIDLGFSTVPRQLFPTTKGTHKVVVGASDYAGNTATQEFTYTVD